ncbi:copper resistance CopC family protein [Micromonospora sp. NPDC050686]|uniref:copper resistance CopC family protein n=1 Tax=Micromonospora sp. NPDC050686 TaxID=3154631 RepID=UPI0033D9BDC7
MAGPAVRPARAVGAGRVAGLAVAALALGVPLLGVLVAAAPVRLVAAAPADRAVRAQPPSEVTMTFDRPPTVSGTHLSVAAPDGTARVGRPTVRGRTVSVAVPPAGDGTYLVAYHAEFGAGRELTGTIRFVVRRDAGPDAAAAGAGRPDAAGPAVDRSDAVDPPGPSGSTGGGHSHGVPTEPWVLLLLGFDLLVLAVVGLRLRRRRRPHLRGRMSRRGCTD